MTGKPPKNFYTPRTDFSKGIRTPSDGKVDAKFQLYAKTRESHFILKNMIGGTSHESPREAEHSKESHNSTGAHCSRSNSPIYQGKITQVSKIIGERSSSSSDYDQKAKENYGVLVNQKKTLSSKCDTSRNNSRNKERIKTEASPSPGGLGATIDFGKFQQGTQGPICFTQDNRRVSGEEVERGTYSMGGVVSSGIVGRSSINSIINHGLINNQNPTRIYADCFSLSPNPQENSKAPSQKQQTPGSSKQFMSPPSTKKLFDTIQNQKIIKNISDCLVPQSAFRPSSPGYFGFLNKGKTSLESNMQKPLFSNFSQTQALRSSHFPKTTSTEPHKTPPSSSYSRPAHAGGANQPSLNSTTRSAFQLEESTLDYFIGIEATIFRIYDCLQVNTDMYSEIRFYLSLVQSVSLDGFENMFEGEETQQLLRTAIILERCAIFMLYYFYLHPEKIRQSRLSLKNLLFYTYRNLFWVLEQLLPKISYHKHYEKYTEKLTQVMGNKQKYFVQQGQSGSEVILQGIQQALGGLEGLTQQVERKILEGFWSFVRSVMEECCSIDEGLQHCLAIFSEACLREQFVAKQGASVELMSSPDEEANSDCSYLSPIHSDSSRVPSSPDSTPILQGKRSDAYNCPLLFEHNSETPQLFSLFPKYSNSTQQQPPLQPVSDVFFNDSLVYKDKVNSFAEHLSNETNSTRQPNLKPKPQPSSFERKSSEGKLVPKENWLLPASPKCSKYTLVVDLDETLVHFKNEGDDEGQFLIRPYAQEFLDEMAKYYEVVIFTAAMQEYADWILDRLDENKSISYRLYRHHTNQQGNIFLKDLNQLGRSLSKTIIIDNVAENFQLTPDNGIFIKSWTDDPDDCALIELCPILASSPDDSHFSFLWFWLIQRGNCGLFVNLLCELGEKRR